MPNLHDAPGHDIEERDAAKRSRVGAAPIRVRPAPEEAADA